MNAISVLTILLILKVGIIFADSIAIIADGTESLARLGILNKYKEGLKTVVEIIGVIDPKNNVTFIKFGDDNESKIIFSGHINVSNIRTLFSTIDEEWSPDNLYKVRTSFYSGFATALKSGKKYDLTIFITDGFHNSKRKGLEDLKKEFGHSLKNLGKVLILHVKPSGGKLSGGAEKILEAWAEVLNGEIMYTETGKLIQAFINLILKHKIENFIVGYGYVFEDTLSINKYYESSELHLIVYPAVKLSGKGKTYHGYKISYANVKHGRGKFIYSLGKGWKKKFVFYYETGRYTHQVNIEPKKNQYFKGESVTVSLKFKANNKEITDELFKRAMTYQFKLGDEELSPKNLINNEVISISLRNMGKQDLYLRYSPFEDVLPRKDYVKVSSFTVRKKANLLNIVIEPEEIYELQKFIIKARPEGLNITSFVLRIEGIDVNYSKVVNLIKEGEIYTAKLSLRKGTYRIVPEGKYRLGGVTVINVLPRRIAIDIYECDKNFKNCDYDEDHSLEYPTSSRRLIFSVPIYMFMDGKDRFYVARIRVKPLFDDESAEYSFSSVNSIKFKGEFESYPIFQILPISFGTKESNITAKIKTVVKDNNLDINLKFLVPSNLKLISEIPPKRVIENLNISLNDERLGNYEVYMGLTPTGQVEFLLYRSYIIVRNLIILGILAIITLIILYLRRRHLLNKMGMVRSVARFRGDEFWEEIPAKVRHIFDDNKINLRNVIYDSILAKKAAKAWDTAHLKRFLEKLKKPKEGVEISLNLNTPVEVFGFVSEDWESKNKQVFLRNENMKNESFTVVLKKDVQLDENFWEINVRSLNFKLTGEKNPASGKINIYRDRVEGFFGEYKFTLSLQGGKGVLRLYKVK